MLCLYCDTVVDVSALPTRPEFVVCTPCTDELNDEEGREDAVLNATRRYL